MRTLFPGTQEYRHKHAGVDIFARVGGSGPPLLLVHGTADTRVRPRNSVELARTMTRAGAPTQAVLLDGVTHEGLIMMFARPFSRDSRAVTQSGDRPCPAPTGACVR